MSYFELEHYRIPPWVQKAIQRLNRGPITPDMGSRNAESNIKIVIMVT